MHLTMVTALSEWTSVSVLSILNFADNFEAHSSVPCALDNLPFNTASSALSCRLEYGLIIHYFNGHVSSPTRTCGSFNSIHGRQFSGGIRASYWNFETMCTLKLFHRHFFATVPKCQCTWLCSLHLLRLEELWNGTGCNCNTLILRNL
jgi:hypothetical protein